MWNKYLNTCSKLLFKHLSLPLCCILFSRLRRLHCKCVTKWRPWALWQPNQPSAMRTSCVTAGSSSCLSLVCRVREDTFLYCPNVIVIMQSCKHKALNFNCPTGQLSLSKTSVLVVGCGGLGCPLAQYLAAAGIGMLSITCLHEPQKDIQKNWKPENNVGLSKHWDY